MIERAHSLFVSLQKGEDNDMENKTTVIIALILVLYLITKPK